MSERRPSSSPTPTSEGVRGGLGRRPPFRARLATFVVVAVAALGVLSLSPLAEVQAVEVRGAGGRSDPQLEAVTDLVGDSIVWVDAGSVERGLQQIAWVERARVTKDFVGRILNVELVQRSAAAYLRSPEGVVLLDAAGVAYEVTSTPPPGVLELTGQVGPARIGSVFEEASRVIFCAELLGRWTKEPFVGGGVSAGAVFLVTKGGSEVRVGDASDLNEKGRALRAMQERVAAEGWRVRRYNVVAATAPALERA